MKVSGAMGFIITNLVHFWSVAFLSITWYKHESSMGLGLILLGLIAILSGLIDAKVLSAHPEK